VSDADERQPLIIYTASSPRVFVNFFLESFAALREQGFEVACACPEEEGAELLWGAGVELIRIPQGRSPNPATAAVTLLLLTSQFIERKPLLVHSHTTTLHLLTALAARGAGVPACVATVHGHYHTGLELIDPVTAGLKGAMSRGYYRALGGLVDAYLVINEAERAALAGEAFSNKLHLIAGGVGVDLERFHPARGPGRAEARRRLGLGVQQAQVGFVGRLLPHKAAELLAIMDRLHAQEPTLGFVVAALMEGDAALEAGLRAREARGVPLVVLRDRAPSEMPLIYQALDLLVLPSRREGASTVLMEAAAMGVPAVAYDIAGTRDLIEQGRTGALIPVGDVEGFVGACLDLLRAPGRREEVGARARRLAERAFSRSWSQEQVFKIYDRLLREKLSIPEEAPG
jgi:glycosyltransferase involved in cell wall biosynthesis